MYCYFCRSSPKNDDELCAGLPEDEIWWNELWNASIRFCSRNDTFAMSVFDDGHYAFVFVRSIRTICTIQHYVLCTGNRAAVRSTVTRRPPERSLNLWYYSKSEFRAPVDVECCRCRNWILYETRGFLPETPKKRGLMSCPGGAEEKRKKPRASFVVLVPCLSGVLGGKKKTPIQWNAFRSRRYANEFDPLSGTRIAFSVVIFPLTRRFFPPSLSGCDAGIDVYVYVFSSVARKSDHKLSLLSRGTVLSTRDIRRGYRVPVKFVPLCRVFETRVFTTVYVDRTYSEDLKNRAPSTWKFSSLFRTRKQVLFHCYVRS